MGACVCECVVCVCRYVTVCVKGHVCAGVCVCRMCECVVCVCVGM